MKSFEFLTLELSLLCFVVSVTGVIRVNHDVDDSSIYKKYLDLDKRLQEVMDHSVKKFLPTILSLGRSLNVSARCMGEVLAVAQGVRELKMWALRFLDANPKPPSGFLRGQGVLLGDFDECMRITVPGEDGSDEDFRGQYCLVEYKPLFPRVEGAVNAEDGIKPFKEAVGNGSDFIRYVAHFSYVFVLADAKIGLCVPSGCTEEEIQRSVQQLGSRVMMKATVHSCQVEKPSKQLDSRQICTILILCLFGAFGVIASIVEHCLKENKEGKRNMFTKSLLCFSATGNVQKLLDTDTTREALSCVHGIRVLTLFYILLHHQFTLLDLVPNMRNVLDLGIYSQRYSFQLVLNASLCVEVFMLLGGILQSYSRIRRETDGSLTDKKPEYIRNIFLRIWRLTPLYIVATLLLFLMEPRGAFTPEVKRRRWKTCEKNWWWNVLFIHNFLKFSDMCMLHTWYVSADVQMFLLSLMPIGLLIRRERAGVVLSSLLMAIGILITVAWCLTLDSPPASILAIVPSKESWYEHLRAYTMPFCHIAPYFTGVVLGFYLKKKRGIEIPKVWQFIGWPLAFVMSSSMLLATRGWNNGHPFSQLEVSLYFGFSKLVYVLGVAWMVLCCSTGHGGIINYILSMKLWIPLSRLSYAAYLVSMVIQIFHRANGRYLEDFHEMHVIWRHFGDIAVSFLMACPLVVFVEMPFMRLQKVLFPWDGKTAKSCAENAVDHNENP